MRFVVLRLQKRKWFAARDGRIQMSSLVFGSAAEYARNRPSGDQDDAHFATSDFSRASSAPAPLAARTYRLKGPSRDEENAIRRPSGDHTGDQSFGGTEVSRVTVPRDNSISQTLEIFEDSVSILPRATIDSSGESEICR